MAVKKIKKKKAESVTYNRTPSTSSNSNVQIDTNLDGSDIVEEKDITIFEHDFLEVESIDHLSDTRVRKILTNSASGIFGMPYSYPNIIDTIPTGSSKHPMDTSSIGEGFGRKFSDKITSVMPVIFISPGMPSYLPTYSEADKRASLNAYGGDDNLLNEMKKDDGKDTPFYTFNSTFNKFKDYVNVQVRALAILMGLSEERYYEGSRPLRKFRIEDILNNDFKNLFNANTSVAFYLDSDASVSENFSNSTTESMIASTVSGLSDKAKEINFIMGSVNAGWAYDTLQAATGVAGDAVQGAADTVGLGKGILGRLSSSLTTVVSGGKLTFPEIWSGSEYSRSYNISLKLRSPDPDPLSILLNIYIPICCLISMTAPLQADGSANAYLSPFLVRATYKSIFNCELGMITSLDITKGGEDNWNALGMPTSADVTLTIKDLYSDMFISNDTHQMLNNVSQMDYLCLAAGVDMNKHWLARKAKLNVLTFTNDFTDIPRNAWETLKTASNKGVTGFLNAALGSDIRWNR